MSIMELKRFAGSKALRVGGVGDCGVSCGSGEMGDKSSGWRGGLVRVVGVPSQKPCVSVDVLV